MVPTHTARHLTKFLIQTAITDQEKYLVPVHFVHNQGVYVAFDLHKLTLLLLGFDVFSFLPSYKNRPQWPPNPPPLCEAHLFSQHPTSADQSSPLPHMHTIPNKSCLPIRALVKSVWLLGSYHMFVKPFFKSSCKHSQLFLNPLTILQSITSYFRFS